MPDARYAAQAIARPDSPPVAGTEAAPVDAPVRPAPWHAAAMTAVVVIVVVGLALALRRRMRRGGA
jgi:hypothetical protein